MSIKKLREVLSKGKVTFGAKETIKNIKNGKVKTVFLASNCPSETKEDLNQYKKYNKTEIIQLDQPSDELMLICKKNFPVTVLSC